MRVSKDVAWLSADSMEPCDKVSMPTSTLEVLSAHRADTGEVVELVRYTYSQGLHNYLYLIYQAREVM
jgi:hypothetical protein